MARASLSFSEWGLRHFHDSIFIIQILKCSKSTSKSDVRHVQSRPDTSLYAFMQCINVYKKYIQLSVDIKIYRPGRGIYARFILSHKCIYYMYTHLCIYASFGDYVILIQKILNFIIIRKSKKERLIKR